MVQKRWSELYDKEESKRLQTAIMNQYYEDNLGDEEFAGCHKWPQISIHWSSDIYISYFILN